MSKSFRIIISIIFFLLFYYMVYPTILTWFSPNPQGQDTKARLEMDKFKLMVEMYRYDHNGKIPALSIDPTPYLGKYTHPIFKMSNLKKWPASENEELLLVYNASPKPRILSLKGFLSPYKKIRGWPEETIPERRYALFTNGTIKVILESEFEKFLKTEEEKISELGYD